MRYIKKFNENSISNEDIKGLKEIKDTLSFILRNKYEDDNNALEEQIAWLDNFINRQKINEEVSPYANWKDSDSIYVDEIPHYADLFTINEFDEMIEDQNIMEEDGIGYYSDGEHMARKFPVFYTKKPEGATHVVWFNK